MKNNFVTFTLILTSLISIQSFATDTDAKAKDTSAKSNEKGMFDAPISGKVLEKINASDYTYLKIKTDKEETWVAVPRLEIELNTQVELQKPIPMFGFESKTLKRKFDRIYFGVLKSQKEEILKKNKAKK